MPARGAITPIALAAMEVLHEGPRHPYELHQTLQERETWRLLKLTAGSLYHAIDRLAQDGLIEAVETSRAGRRPERTIYQLTGAGRDAFAQRLRTLVAEPVEEYPRYAAAVAMLHTLDQADALRQLRRRLVTLEATEAAELVYRQRLIEEGLHPMYWIDVEYRTRMRATELAWTRELIGRLTAGELGWPVDSGAGQPNITKTDKPRLSVVDGGEREHAG